MGQIPIMSKQADAAAKPHAISPRIYLNKLIAPSLPKDAVKRRRLIDDLLESDKQVVVLLAPAGFGKTILMTQLYNELAEKSQPVSWLYLHDRDNDFSRFIIYLREAILRMDLFPWSPNQVVTEAGESAFLDLRAESFELIDLIASTPTPFTLFIDEFESIHSPDVISFVSELISSLNPGQRVVISSRTILALPLTSLEMNGQLIKIDSDELVFDLEEAARFLKNQTQINLTTNDISLLQQKTEGWAAALRLVSLALPLSGDASAWIEALSGRTDSIAQYLAENVLSRLPEELCRFMLETSILEHLYGGLCDAVLESTGSAEIIDDIYRLNLFLMPFESKVNSYKFHSLFRSFLATQLRRANPEIIPTLHRRAAVFFFSHGRISDALYHANQSEDNMLMVDILELGSLRFVELGQLTTVAKWLDTVDPSLISDRPNIQRARAYSMIALHRYGEAQDALAKLRTLAAEQGKELDPEATLQLALMYEWMDRHDLSAAEVARISEQVASENHFAFGICRNIMANLSMINCDYTSAQNLLDSAKAAYEKNTLDSWPSVYTTCFEGVLEMRLGNARAGIQRFETGLAHASSAGQSIPCAYLADALYAKGELERAGSMAEEHLSFNRQVAPPDIVILSFRTAARICFLNGNLDRSELLLTELGDIGDMRGLDRLKASAWLEKSRIALLCGDTASASRYFTLGSNENIWRAHQGACYYPQELDDQEIAGMRMDLVLGDVDLAANRLEKSLNESKLRGRHLRKIRLQCLLAQTYSRLRKRKQGLDLLEDALQSASKNSLIYIFADEPWCLLELLEELSHKTTRINIDYLNKVISATKLVAERIGELLISKKQLNLLTLKETAIIKLVADGKVNKELSRILNITDNTVETHLRRINQKLDTKNRTQAVAKAREMGLLP
jgi:LuxR family maltose regulon positive regulatory protein